MASWKRGFTLGELLVVLALFGTLTAIALPHWVALLPSYRLNSATRQVQSELHSIKSLAAFRNRRFQLNFSAANDTYTIEDTITDPPTSLGTKPLPAGIDIRNNITIGFTPRGTGDSGTVNLCNAQSAGRNIVVSGTGRIRIVNATC